MIVGAEVLKFVLFGAVGWIITQFIAGPLVRFLTLRAEVEAERVRSLQLPPGPYKKMMTLDGKIRDPAATCSEAKRRLFDLARQVGVFRKTEIAAPLLRVVFDLRTIEATLNGLASELHDGEKRIDANKALLKATRIRP